MDSDAHFQLSAVNATSEWDKYAVKTYQAWYGVDDVYDGDIRDLDLSLIPQHDVLCAGFPLPAFFSRWSIKEKFSRA